MFKKAIIPSKIYKGQNYSKSTYSGFSKILFTINHKLLDLNVEQKYNEKIVEIGGGAEPHIKYMNTDFIKSYTIVDDISYKHAVQKLQSKYKRIKFYFIDYKKINFSKKYDFTRMIASHSFEHFRFFESDFLKLMKLLEKNGIISIALPCDPGLFWRFLQFFSFFNQKKYYGWKNMKQKDLSDTREHLTSCQNILKIIKFYFSNIKKIYFPFFIPLIEFNIFLIIQVNVSKFIKLNKSI